MMQKQQSTMSQNTDKISHFSKAQFVDSLSKFVPSLVIQKIIRSGDEPQSRQTLPELQAMETVVMFADISGFTNLSESCAKNGLQGNEDLAFCINRYMEGMVRYLNQYGGDIIKFVGDAMIVMWPPIDTSNSNLQTLRMDTIRRAIQCGQDIQKTMHNFQLLPGINLSVKIGIGYGQCGILYVGGVFNRAETLTVGDALVDALMSEGMASGGGEVIVADSCFKIVQDFFKADRLVNPDSKQAFHKINLKYMANRVKIQADAIKLRAQFNSEVLQSIKRKLMGCVPHCVIPFLKIEQENFASEVRSLTVMFLSLGVDLSSAATQQGMEKIQSIVTEVQKQVYRLQGSINKLVMDDKGSTMICIWGLLPLAHFDDASRALLTGFNIMNALRKIPDTYCNIGVSSGECFSGITGTSGSRKEFSVLGDIVNLAARIMGSMKGKEQNSIKCDLNTRMLAANDFDFKYERHAELKGKSVSIPFFRPMDPTEKFNTASQKILKPDFFLQEHQNPMHLERDTNYDRRKKTIGFETTLRGLINEITDYSSPNKKGLLKPYVAVLKGQIGSGKTAFMKHLFNDMQNMPIFQPYLERNKGKLPIFTSNTNAETTLQFLNIWRPIYQMLLWYHCKRTGVKREVFIGETIIKSDNKDKANLICELVGIQKQHLGAKYLAQLDVEQVKPKENQIAFVQMPDYEVDVKNELCEYLVNIFQLLIGEGKELLSDWGSCDSDNQLIGNKLGGKKSSDSDADDFQEPPIIVCLDDAQNMCPTSWKLMHEILSQCEHFMLFLVIKSDDKDRLLIKIESAPAFETAWQSISDDIEVNIIDLPILTKDQIRQVIVASAEEYKTSYTNEVKDMTTILDPDNTIKDIEMSAEWRKYLFEQYQLKTRISGLDPNIVEVIATNCQKNILLCLQYFVNMLQNGFISVNGQGYVEPTKLFEKCKLIDEWTTVPVPRIAWKINMQSTSEFFFSIHAKGKNKKPGELKGATIAIVILKVCSVLGHEFGLEALKYISPLSKNSLNMKRIDQAIRLLEQRDFLEIVDCTDPSNQLCRFRKPLMRETMYQMLRYKGIKKDLHAATERYLQKLQSTQTLSQLQAKIKAEKLLRHMLLAQDCKEEAGLMQERRTALTVVRIQNLLQRRPNCTVLVEKIMKPSNQGKLGNVKKIVNTTNMVSKYVTLSRTQLKWYDNEEELSHDQFHGCVKLQFIYEVVKMSLIGSDASFRLGVSLYTQRGKEHAGRRDLIFSCEKPFDRDKWIAAIDYLKTRAIYEAYSKNNRLVSFMHANNEIKQGQDKDEDQNEMDKSELLYDFGEQLKQQTMSQFGNQAPLKQNSLGRNNSLNPRKSSFINQRTSTTSIHNIKAQQPITEVKAPELVKKLTLLYKVGMTSFVHHLHKMNLKNPNAVGVSHAQKKEVDELMQYPPQMSAIKELINHELVDDEIRTQLARQGSSSSDRSRASFIGTLGGIHEDIQRKLTQQKTIRALQSKQEERDSNASSQDDPPFFQQTVTLQKKNKDGSQFKKTVNEHKKFKEQKRQSSLSAGLQQKNNMIFDPSQLIAEVNESSVSSNGVDSSDRSRSNNNMRSLNQKNLFIPNQIVKVQSDLVVIDQSSNQLSHGEETKDSSPNVLPSVNGRFSNRNHQRRSNKKSNRISFQKSPKDSRVDDTMESALVDMLRLQQDKIDQMLRQQQEFQLQMTQHQQILTSQTFQQALRRHSVTIQGDSGQTLILPHQSNYNATQSQIHASRRDSSVLQHQSQDGETQDQNADQSNKASALLLEQQRSARRFTFCNNDVSIDSKQIQKRGPNQQARKSAPGGLYLGQNLIQKSGSSAAGEDDGETDVLTPQLSSAFAQQQQYIGMASEEKRHLKKQQSEQLRSSDALIQGQQHETFNQNQFMAGHGPQISEEMQMSSAPKQPVSNHSNLQSPKGSEEEDQNSLEGPEVIFEYLRQDSKAESGNCDVINRRPVKSFDNSSIQQNSQSVTPLTQLDNMILDNQTPATQQQYNSNRNYLGQGHNAWDHQREQSQVAAYGDGNDDNGSRDDKDNQEEGTASAINQCNPVSSDSIQKREQEFKSIALVSPRRNEKKRPFSNELTSVNMTPEKFKNSISPRQQFKIGLEMQHKKIGDISNQNGPEVKASRPNMNQRNFSATQAVRRTHCRFGNIHNNYLLPVHNQDTTNGRNVEDSEYIYSPKLNQGSGKNSSENASSSQLRLSDILQKRQK